MDFLASLQDTWKMIDGTSLACIYIFFSCEESLVCKIILQEGTTRKDSYLATSPAVFLCCAKLSDEENVQYYFIFFTNQC